MSGARCAKKLACNAPVAAMSETVDGIVFRLLVPALEGGGIDQERFNALLDQATAADEDYVERQKACVSAMCRALGIASPYA